MNSNYTLLAARVAEVLREHGVDPLQGFYNLVFDQIGMRSLEFRVDAFGNVDGARHTLATVRDWAKLGQLYVQNGKWNGKQILPTWWRSYVSRSGGVTEGLSQRYGAGFFLDIPGNNETGENSKYQPKGALFAWGTEYQYLAIWPKQQVVMVLTSDANDANVKLDAYERLSREVLKQLRAGDLG